MTRGHTGTKVKDGKSAYYPWGKILPSGGVTNVMKSHFKEALLTGLSMTTQLSKYLP